MPTLAQRISTFLQSPKGRQLVDRGRREMAKPSTQQKVRGVISKLSGRR